MFSYRSPFLVLPCPAAYTPLSPFLASQMATIGRLSDRPAVEPPGQAITPFAVELPCRP